MKRLMQILISGLCILAWSGSIIAGSSAWEYSEDIPGIGLVVDSIELDGVIINNFSFENGHEYIVVKPNEKFKVHMHYAVNASDLTRLKLHHFIIGLYDDGPQQCILHSLGVFDSSGSVTIQLKAPKNPGVYQVRFCHTTGLTAEQTLQAWWQGDLRPDQSIVGVVMVK